MDREILIKFIIYTMNYYGSNAGERARPGSKLKSQAEHIADFVEQWEMAQANASRDNFELVKLVVQPINKL